MTSYFSLIEWPGPFLDFFEFVGIFLALGAVGFRYSALRGRLESGESTVFQQMARRAALFGLIGAMLYMIHLIQVLPRVAHRAKVPVSTFLTTPSVTVSIYYLILLAMMGLLMAAFGKRVGWPLAAFALVAGQLRNIVGLQWGRLVTPVHVLMGGLWIGTLFVLVVAGVSVLLNSNVDRDRRGVVVADLVNDFSPLALTCGILVVVFGVIAAFRELEPFSALWTTPYGYTLIAKVCVVAVVLSLGAWNWKRQRPTLGSEEAAFSIRRSATIELIAATVVLMITAVMLNLPKKD